jgi:spermidine/putrescine transport system permease protein
MLRRNPVAWGFIGIPLAWLMVFFVAPLVLMAVYSLRPDMRGGLFTLGWTPTLDHYTTILDKRDYLRLLWLSIRTAFLIAAISTLLAYPLAYFLAFRAEKRRSLLLVLLLLPFWTSYLLRIIAWKIILGSNGLLNNVLIDLHLVSEPSTLLLYSRWAVVITLVYVWLPFVALPIYAALQRVDRSLLEAAAILGAPPPVAFWRVTFPLSLPGVVAGFFMVFIPTVGEYVTPALVGGSRGSLYGNIIATFFGQGLNWPLGSALALIMLVTVLTLAAAISRLVDLRRFLD